MAPYIYKVRSWAHVFSSDFHIHLLSKAGQEYVPYITYDKTEA